MKDLLPCLWYRLYHYPLYLWHREVTGNKTKAAKHLYGPVVRYVWNGDTLLNLRKGEFVGPEINKPVKYEWK